jgi:hypothetical protein
MILNQTTFRGSFCPNNCGLTSVRLMELMFDIQQYGQPPADIIRDLAPGLKFDENGMPIMPNMGAGMMPDLGGQVPNMGEATTAMANGQCTIM